MSIFYIAGKPGGGKSYLAVFQICEELKSGKGRYIVTNIALNLPELAVWCHENIKDEVNLSERVRVLDDSEAGEFWLYEPHKKYDQRREIKVGKRVIEVPDFSERGSPGCLYVIDEVHNYFGAREWQATGSDCTWFLSQHRKMGCDVVLVTQHPDQTDKALRRLAQEYMTVRNLSREPIFGFRIANFFRYIRSLNSPTSPNPGAFDSGFIRLKPEVYGKLYDTMAGVGIAGRVSPTFEKRGIHWAWLLAPVVGVLIFFTWLYTHLGTVSAAMHNGFNRAFFHFGTQAMNHSFVPGLPPVSHPAGDGPRQVDPAKAFHENRNESGPVEGVASVTNYVAPVYCTGYCAVPGCVMVFLSDGRIARSDWGDVQYIRAEKVGVFGSSFLVYTTAQIERSNPSMTSAGATPSGLPANPAPLSSVSSESPPIILPNRDYRANLHDLKTASFQKPNSVSDATQY
jgi:hypothetical protein